VLNYWNAHGPCSIMQVCRALGVDRSSIYRILRAVYGPDFRQRWPQGANTPADRVTIPLAA
jgi:hypothetical protein